jgi:uroporphyrinogen-III decarboxylase
VNHRDRALAAMRGEVVDHVPFIARMDLWYSFHRNQGTLPSPYERASLWDIQRDLGIGIFGFGAWDVSFYRLEHRGVEIDTEASGGLTSTRYSTPFGTLTCRDKMAAELHEAAGTGARIEYPFKTPNDYDALQYLIEHAVVVENYDAYGRFVDAIGTDGLALPFSGHLPAHQLMLNFMGYQTFYYEMHDRPTRVEALIQALTDQQREILGLAAGCPAQAIEVGGNYDEHMTPPPVFDRLFAPFYREARRVLSEGNKILVVHGDGEMVVLLEKLMDCGVQVVEALTPSPMTSIDIRETRRLWGNRVAMWGGLASVMLTRTFTEEALEGFLEDLFTAVAPGDRFILGFGDNVPTDALFGRIKRVAQFWAERGGYPLPTPSV